MLLRTFSRVSVQRAVSIKRFNSIVSFKLADIGEGIAEVELLKWFVKKGDNVKAFDRLCEVQSDKANVEITSRYDGIITAVHHAEGSIVKVGETLVDIQTGTTSAVTAPSPPPTPTPSVINNSNSVVAFKLADIGEGIAEVELLKWFVKKGDNVKAFDRLCEVQSDKANVEITSRYDGVITAVHHTEGSIVKVGASLVDIQTSVAQAAPTVSATTPVASASSMVPTTSGTSFGAKALMTPAVRKIVKENSIDIAQLKGTGPKGRILKHDVLDYLANGRSSRSAGAPRQPTESTIMQPQPAQNTSSASTKLDRTVPIRGIQRLMVKNMNAAAQVQHLTLCEEVIFDQIVALRDAFRQNMKEKSIKITYLPILIKATSLALSEFPQLNATVSSDASEITYHANHNIGIAMDTPRGLIVPVIRHVQDLSVLEIAAELSVLQEAAQKGTLTEAQLSGGTFSLSNIGSVGGTYATPVLVIPQVAIGAFGRSQIVPRYVDNSGRPASNELIRSGKAVVAPTTIMSVSWSADHRVVDGATVGRFSNAWRRYLEEPFAMIAKLR